MRKQPVPEKESVWNGPVSERMPAFIYPGKERTMARIKKLSKCLPRLLAAAVAVCSGVPRAAMNTALTVGTAALLVFMTGYGAFREDVYAKKNG